MRQLVSTQNLCKVWFVQVSLMLWPTGVGGALISNLLCTTKIIGPSTPNSKSITGSYKYTLPGHNIRYAWTNQNSELCFCHCDLWTTLRAQKVILTPYKPLQHIPILVASYFLNSRLVNSERIKTRSRKGMIVENIQYFVGRWQTLHPRLLWNVTLKAPSRLPSARAGVQTATKVSAGLITWWWLHFNEVRPLAALSRMELYGFDDNKRKDHFICLHSIQTDCWYQWGNEGNSAWFYFGVIVFFFLFLICN